MSLFVDLDKDGLTGGLQLSIGDDSGGFRIAGPKYCGQSKRLQRVTLTDYDAARIRGYLDRHFPEQKEAADALA